MAISETHAEFLAALYAGRYCPSFKGNPHVEHVYVSTPESVLSGMSQERRHPCPAYEEGLRAYMMLTEDSSTAFASPAPKPNHQGGR